LSFFPKIKILSKKKDPYLDCYYQGKDTPGIEYSSDSALGDLSGNTSEYKLSGEDSDESTDVIEGHADVKDDCTEIKFTKLLENSVFKYNIDAQPKKESESDDSDLNKEMSDSQS
jgi:hypothetical protein